MQAIQTPVPGDKQQAVIDAQVIDTPEKLKTAIDEIREFLSTPGVVSVMDQDPGMMLSNLWVMGDKMSQPQLIVLRRNAAIVCIAPFLLQKKRLPLRFSVYQLAAITPWQLRLVGRDIVLHPDICAADCLPTLLRALDQHAGHTRIISLPELPAGTALHDAIAGTARRPLTPWRVRNVTSKQQSIVQHLLAGSYDDWFMSLSGKERNVFRSKHKKLAAREDAPVSFRKYTRPEDVEEFLEALETVYWHSWQGKTYGKRPRKTGHAIERLREAASRGWLRSYALYVGDQPVSFELGFQYKGVFEGTETGYDLDYSRLSPGAILIHLVIKDLYEVDPPQVLDWGFGAADYKQRLSNVEIPAYSYFLVKPSPILLYIDLQRLLNTVYQGLHSLSVRLGLERRMRGALKKKVRN